MKTTLRLLALFSLVFSFILCTQASAADVVAAPSGITSANIVTWLTPVLVPLLVALTKKALPSVPSWALPILAPVLGVVLDLVNTYAAGNQSNLVLAALLGLAGVGVREVKDQLTPAKDTTP